ncbi:MAG: NUDIX domain-containing protein [Candidatus Pacearchaeota archaeon]|nr:NUDIX domain-containing protein [Candidatus Pacearchaeota archaeon]
MNEIIKPKREFVATVYIVRDKKVLLIFHNDIKKFIPISGHIEENELPDETAVREAKKETGFDIQLLGKEKAEIATSRITKRKELIKNISIGLDIIKPEHHHINLAYAAIIIGGEQLEISDEGTELRWFSADELINNNEILENVKRDALEALNLATNHTNT